jgi:hypothetical protein
VTVARVRPSFLLGAFALATGCSPAAPPPATPGPPPSATVPPPAAPPAPAPPAATASPPAAAAPRVVPGEPLGSPVTNAATTSSGEVADADEVIVRLRPRFQRCYETVRAAGPEIGGMVTCGLRISRAGKVAAVSVVRRSGLPNPLVDCIVTELKTAAFKPLAEEAHVQVPVRFALPGDD